MVGRTGNLQTDDRNSFVNDSSGNVARNVVAEIPDTVDSAPVGLSTDFKVTTFNIGDTESLLPPSVLATRNFMIVINLSETDSIFVGKTGVVAGNGLGTTAGYEIPPQETFNIAIKANVEVQLYGIAESGKTVLCKVVEVA